jgi:UDP-N-acetylmuramate dehydrogenase
VIVEAAFRVQAGDPTAIRKQRQSIARRRAWMHRFRSAGSAFRNPPGDHAGRLLEAAGLKGARIGGVRVTRQHANVIAAGREACASDVLAMTEHMRSRVEDRFGIRLDTEIIMV